MNFAKKIQHIDVIHLGDELLLGLRANTHLEYLGRTFNQYGVTLKSDQVIRDNNLEIQNCLEHTWPNTEMLITTGGLGPTVDDITRQAIADFLGLKLEFNQGILDTIQERFKSRGSIMGDNNRTQAYQLEGATVLPNPNGTAPGMLLEHQNKLLVMLPGPPRELIPMVEDELLPRLIENGIIEEHKNYVQIRTCGIGESALEEKVKPLLEDFQNVQVAYCVHSGVVDMRFAAVDSNQGLTSAMECAEKISEALGEDFIGYGEFNIAHSIVATLAAHGQNIATAESCTGGLIAGALTDIPGASEVISGGIVAYSVDSKVQTLGIPEDFILQHGAVSAETAMAMATAAAEAFSSEYGLSTTGYAGPTGGTEKDPVGTVYIGYHSPAGAWAKRIFINGERELVRKRAVVYALDLVRRKLRKYREQDDQFRSSNTIH